MLKWLNKIFKIFIDFLVFIIIALIFFMLYNMVSLRLFNQKYVNTFGYTIFEVASGSMEPTINVNDLIIVKLTKKIEKGDIVTYISGDDFITHRVMHVNGKEITTKGDANNSEDCEVELEDLLGKVVFIVPKGGIVRSVLFTPKVTISIIMSLILFNLCFSYIPKNKRRKKILLDNDFEDVSDVVKKVGD